MDFSKMKYTSIAVITLLALTTIGLIYNTANVRMYLAATSNEVKVKEDLESVKYYDNPANATTGVAKTVLFWTKMFSSDNMLFEKSHSELFENCEVSNCYATSDKTFLPVHQFDAILFHGIQYDFKKNGKPKERSPHQRYVLVDLESPSNNKISLKPFAGFYNWTMTYRTDSDIYRPYGKVVKRTGAAKSTGDVNLAKKSKLIAWFVSNCNTESRREKYVKELQKYIPVDIYGSCGPHKCERLHSSECLKMLETTYKFYLSFENSLCRDYVTEKLFNALDLNVVPVVYGGADYDLVAAPHSVIDVANFKSPQELAKYLMIIDGDDEEYLKYFKWKANYRVELQDVTWAQSACDLCKKLHNVSEQKSVYTDISEWMWGANRSKCKFHTGTFV